MTATAQGSRDVLLRAVREEAFQRHVEHLAAHYGWLVHHALTSRTKSGRWATAQSGHNGFPDLVLAKGGRVIFAELKRETGQVRPEQTRWLAELEKAPGVEVHVWRPRDREAVMEILST